MSCTEYNYRKSTCGTKTQAICTHYHGELPAHSELTNEDCVTIEETTEELYNTQEKILNEIDLSELGDCITYEPQGDKLTVKEVLQALETEICDIKENSKTIVDIKRLDMKCLEDECGVPIKDLTTLFQIIINKLCDGE